MNATFIGVHAYDDRLPDLSVDGLAELAAEAAAQLTRLHQLPAEPLTGAEALDRQLAEGFLRIQSWEAGSAHFAWGNPSLYTGEAVWGVLSLLLRPFAPLADRLEGVVDLADRVFRRERARRIGTGRVDRPDEVDVRDAQRVG